MYFDYFGLIGCHFGVQLGSFVKLLSPIWGLLVLQWIEIQLNVGCFLFQVRDDYVLVGLCQVL